MCKQFYSLILLVLISGICYAQADQRIRKQVNAEDGVALQGYDPVSYFTNNATKGSSSITVDHNGIRYYFSSIEHKQRFLKQPEQYEPQYGGWCAFAMGDSGEKVEIDPETFKILDGKLYVFYNAYFNNTLKKWNSDEQRLKKNADVNWKKLVP